MSEVVTHDENGRLAKGNVWRFRAGSKGQPPRFNYNSMRTSVIEYCETRAQEERPFTWSGLASYLGVTTQTLYRYWHGDVADSIIGKDAICDMLDYYRTIMESQQEERLSDKEYSTSGLIFAMKNQFSDRWTDTKHIEHTNNQQQIHIVIDPNSQLASRLDNDSVTIDQ